MLFWEGDGSFPRSRTGVLQRWRSTYVLTVVMGEIMHEERRRWPRVLAEHLVSYSLFDDQAEPIAMGMARTLDVSEGGILLEMTHPLEVGSHLEIRLVSGEDIVEAEGRVAYSQHMPSGHCRVGVSFTKIAGGDLTIIAQEVEDRQGHRRQGGASSQG